MSKSRRSEDSNENSMRRYFLGRAAGHPGRSVFSNRISPAVRQTQESILGSGTTDLCIYRATGCGVEIGRHFFFIDYLNDDARDGFNDRDFYGEWYPTLSFGKLANKELRVGPIRDFALIAGVNVGGDAGVVKYLPGLRASWDLPEFLFLNTDLTAYIDDNTGVDNGGAPKEDNSFIFDVSWALPFKVGNQSLTIVGHAEYLGSHTNELGHNVKEWILAQPQFTWDLGQAIGAPQQLMVGIEYQYWLNKLGTDEDESTAQLLVVWRL